jgi:hypothetical protein
MWFTSAVLQTLVLSVSVDREELPLSKTMSRQRLSRMRTSACISLVSLYQQARALPEILGSRQVPAVARQRGWWVRQVLREPHVLWAVSIAVRVPAVLTRFGNVRGEELPGALFSRFAHCTWLIRFALVTMESFFYVDARRIRSIIAGTLPFSPA